VLGSTEAQIFAQAGHGLGGLRLGRCIGSWSVVLEVLRLLLAELFTLPLTPLALGPDHVAIGGTGRLWRGG